MTVAAFLYNTFYCNGIKDSFAGLYADKAGAKSVIRGERNGKDTLELMDLETCGITVYEWVPLYEAEETSKHLTLTHRWDKDKPIIEAEWDGDNYRWGHTSIFYDAGGWEQK